MSLSSIQKLITFSIVSAASALAILFFAPSSRALGKKNGLLVLCTTGMIAQIVQNVGGPWVSIDLLMGPGIDPHLYRASESDVHKLSAADLIFYNGLHLEGKMVEVFEYLAPYKKVIALGDYIAQKELLFADKDLYDPHVWHDVSLWRSVICVVEKQLNESDPLHASFYSQQARRYEEKLDELDQWIFKTIETIPVQARLLVTAHDAFAYFGKRYGLRVVGLQGMSTESEVSMRDVQDVATFIAHNKVKALFIETSISERNMRAVQEAVGARGWHVALGPELFSDALGDESTQTHTYEGMIMHNVQAIVSSLA